MNNLFNDADFPFCPHPPKWGIPWDKWYNRFDWFRKLDRVPQSPLHHAEGDVLAHTKLVCRELISLKEWINLPEAEKQILFTAALLHDCAKPICTMVEDGNITSPGHAVKGELLARQILYTAEDFDFLLSFEAREAIAKLVRYHGLPLFFLDKPTPLKTILAANQTIPMNWLFILAKADVLGRECSDKQELLDRITLYSEYCIETNCYEDKRNFPNHFSRYIYFQKENGNPDYKAYDDTKFEVIVLSGLPAAGKDAWIKENALDLPVISLDALRDQFKISPEKDQGVIIHKAKDKAKEYLRKSQPFVWNATNVTKMMRSQLISLFSSYGAKVKLIYLEVPYKEVLRRNSERSRNVPEKVIKRLIEKLEVPEDFEAHEVVKIVKS